MTIPFFYLAAEQWGTTIRCRILMWVSGEKKPLSVTIKLDLEEELEECIVPFKIDIVDFHSLSDEFKHYALEKIDVWNLSKNSILNYQI